MVSVPTTERKVVQPTTFDIRVSHISPQGGVNLSYSNELKSETANAARNMATREICSRLWSRTSRSVSYSIQRDSSRDFHSGIAATCSGCGMTLASTSASFSSSPRSAFTSILALELSCAFRCRALLLLCSPDLECDAPDDREGTLRHFQLLSLLHTLRESSVSRLEGS